MSNERDLLDLEIVQEAILQGEVWAWNSPLLPFILLDQDFEWAEVARGAFIKIIQSETPEPLTKEGLGLLKATILTWWYSMTEDDLAWDFLYMFSKAYPPFEQNPVFKQTLRQLVELIPNLTKEQVDFLNDRKKKLPPNRAESNADSAIDCYHRGDILFLGMRIARAILDAKGVVMDGSNPNLTAEILLVEGQIVRILQESVLLSFWLDKALEERPNAS